MRWFLVLALVAGCPGGGQKIDDTGAGTGTATGSAAPIDAAPQPLVPHGRQVDDDTKLALIGGAMTQLGGVANQCWAAGAVDDYLLKGTVTLEIAVKPGAADAKVVHDTTDDKVLTECLVAVVAAFKWPYELSGEVIELPFAFDAPDGQFVIDRRLVPSKARSGVAVAVLLDEKNANNPAASMLELTFDAAGVLERAKAERHEVWYVVEGGGAIEGAAFEAGAVLDVPAGAYRMVTSTQGMRAVVFLVPGQIEGTARAGAMPGETIGASTGKNAKRKGPKVIAAGAAKVYKADKRVVTMYLDSKAKGAAKDVGLALLELDAGAAVPEHEHAGETEMLYVLAGGAEMVIDGVTLPVIESTVMQIPKATKHQARVTAALRAIQLYTPGGPEQRFKP